MTDLSHSLEARPHRPARMSTEMVVAYVLLAIALLFWGVYMVELFKGMGSLLA